MAAIFGFAGYSGSAPERLQRMAQALAHRGEGDACFFEAPGAAIGSRSRPLKQSGSAAPSGWEGDELRVVLDGRIVNASKLRGQLESEDVQLHSFHDAELVGRLYRSKGDSAFDLLRGPFAIAIWDQARRRLILARDHLGHKPVFYADTAQGFHFASEAKAFLTADIVPFAVDMQALSHFLSLRFIPPPHGLISGIEKLAPAHFLVFEEGQSSVHRYWRPSFATKRTTGLQDTIEGLEDKLQETIAAYLPGSGAPGAFLSGGLDSGLIVANMAKVLDKPFGTFSLGVENESDEVPLARLVAEKFQTSQHESYPRDDVVRLLPAMIWHLDEPSDMVVVSKYLISRMAAPHVDSVMSGDGGDELFAGFMRYLGLRDAQYYGRVPAWLRNRIIRPVARGLGGRRGLNSIAGKVLWLTEVTGAGDLPERYAEAVEYLRFRKADKQELFTDEAWRQIQDVDSNRILIETVRQSDAADPIEKLLHTDFLTRLPEHLLMLDDRTGAAHGVNVLCPLADKELVEHATAIPANMKIRGREAKFIERRLAARALPREVVEFSKTGWSFPFADLCAGSLQPFLRSVFADSRLVRDGIFRKAAIDRIISQHGAGEVDHHIRIWMLLSLEIWYRMASEGLHHQDMVPWMESHLEAARG